MFKPEETPYEVWFGTHCIEYNGDAFHYKGSVESLDKRHETVLSFDKGDRGYYTFFCPANMYTWRQGAEMCINHAMAAKDEYLPKGYAVSYGAGSEMVACAVIFDGAMQSKGVQFTRSPSGCDGIVYANEEHTEFFKLNCGAWEKCEAPTGIRTWIHASGVWVYIPEPNLKAFQTYASELAVSIQGAMNGTSSRTPTESVDSAFKLMTAQQTLKAVTMPMAYIKGPDGRIQVYKDFRWHDADAIPTGEYLVVESDGYVLGAKPGANLGVLRSCLKL